MSSTENAENRDLPSDELSMPIHNITESEIMGKEAIDFQTKESKYRFVIVFVYSFVSFTNTVHFLCFSSCASSFKENYGLNNFEVDLFALIYMIIYPIVIVPQSYIVDNVNMRLGLSIAAGLTIIGSGLKCLLNQSIYYAYIGQFLIALFQPAILSAPSKIASTWFSDKSRVLATSICCSSATIGGLVGFTIHNFFIDPEAKGEEYKAQFWLYIFVEFIGSVILCIPMLIFMRSKPEIAPSLSQNNYVSPQLKENIKNLCLNINFMLVLASTTFINGFFNVLGTIMNQYLSMYKMTDLQITYTNVSGNALGIVSSICVSHLLDGNKKYKKNLIILASIILTACIMVTILLEVISDDYSVYIAFPLYAVMYMSFVPILSITMDYVCELTYPCGESITVGLMIGANQISGTLLVLICDVFLVYYPQNRYLSNAFGVVLFLIGIICFAFIKEKLIRNEKDTRKLITSD